jgi:hypothetical protein
MLQHVEPQYAFCSASRVLQSGLEVTIIASAFGAGSGGACSRNSTGSSWLYGGGGGGGGK